MSLKEWKMVYYPVPAVKVAKEDALDACILKWEGLRAEVRDQYDLKPTTDFDGQPWRLLEDAIHNDMVIDGDTCALCEHHLSVRLEDECEDCPIVKVHDKSCDKEWRQFVDLGDAEPMIELLKATKEAL